MKITEILAGARLTLPILARKAGVKLGYLKQLSAGNAEAGPDTRRKLADALRAHSATLASLADQVDPPA